MTRSTDPAAPVDSRCGRVGYVGNRGRNVFAGDGPAINVNQPTLVGYPNVPQNNRKPFFAGGVTSDLGLGGPFGWTQGIDFFCNCAHNAYDSLQAKFNKQFSAGMSVKMNYTLQREVQESGDYFIYDPELNKGPADWDRTHNVVLSRRELPVGRDRAFLSTRSPAVRRDCRRMEVHTNTIIQRAPVQRQYRTRAPPATPAATTVQLRAALAVEAPATSGSTRRRSSSGQRVLAAARGTLEIDEEPRRGPVLASGRVAVQAFRARAGA